MQTNLNSRASVNRLQSHFSARATNKYIPNYKYIKNAIYPANENNTCGYTAACLILNYWHKVKGNVIDSSFLDKVQHTIIRKLDYIAAGGIINMVNMVNTAVNNNIYAGRKSGSKYNQSKAFQQKEVLETPDVAAVNKYANVQEIYEALKCNVSCRGYEQGQDEIAEKEIQNDEPEISNDSSEKMTVWYQGVPLEEWALTDPKYTDSETGISWYIRDGKYPYMVGEDAEKFRKLCEESGEFALKKFAEMTGLIQKLDDNTVAYVGDNGIAVKSKDGKEMFVDTSGLSYDIVMDMFRNLPRNGNFFSNKYWSDNIQKAQARS